MIIAASYLFADNVPAGFHLGIPYEYELEGAGSIKGVGMFGAVQSPHPESYAANAMNRTVELMQGVCH